MLKLTKMNREPLYINPYLVEITETTPDTLITMLSGKKYYVLETADEVKTAMINYYSELNQSRRRK